MSGINTPLSNNTLAIEGPTVVLITENNSPFDDSSFNSPGGHKSFGGPVKRLYSKVVISNINPYEGENPEKRQQLFKTLAKIGDPKTPTDDQLAAGAFASSFVDGGDTPPEENDENFAPLIHENASAKDVANALMEL